MSVSISGLPVATAATGAELVPVVQSGATKRMTVAQIRAGLAAAGNNSDITQMLGLTTALSIGQGGTGAKTISDAKINLGFMTPGDFGLGGSSIAQNGDLSTLTLSEFYVTSATTLNVPLGQGTAAGQGVGISYQHPNTSYGSQLWTQYNTNRSFIRTRVAGTFLGWNEISFLDVPTRVGQYTLATLPSASGFPAYEIDVTNATGGSKRCRSNGTVWQILNTTTTVS